MFRVNFSHGEREEKAAVVERIRALETKHNHPIAILADLQGPKLRVGKFKDGQAVIRHSGHFTLDRNPEPGDETERWAWKDHWGVPLSPPPALRRCNHGPPTFRPSTRRCCR